MSKKKTRRVGYHTLVPTRSRRGKHIEWVCVIPGCAYYDYGSGSAYRHMKTCPLDRFQASNENNIETKAEKKDSNGVRSRQWKMPKSSARTR